MFKEMRENEKGFTLVELIVVIAIMAVLAALLIPRIMGNVSDAARQTEITTAQTLASEITIYNAKALTDNDDTTNPVSPAGTYVVEGELPTALALPSGTDFPDPTVVQIIIDASGNASIAIQP